MGRTDRDGHVRLALNGDGERDFDLAIGKAAVVHRGGQRIFF